MFSPPNQLEINENEKKEKKAGEWEEVRELNGLLVMMLGQKVDKGWCWVSLVEDETLMKCRSARKRNFKKVFPQTQPWLRLSRPQTLRVHSTSTTPKRKTPSVTTHSSSPASLQPTIDRRIRRKISRFLYQMFAISSDSPYQCRAAIVEKQKIYRMRSWLSTFMCGNKHQIPTGAAERGRRSLKLHELN